MLGARLGDLVAGLDGIGSLAIPYARLPRRWSIYAEEFRRWTDVADQTPEALLLRPKLGAAAVGALIEAAHDAVRTSQSAVAAGTVGAEAAVARLAAQLDDFDRTILSELVWNPDPPTQRAVAERLGVHPVSVQRNLPRARARFAELLADPAHREVGDHAESLRRHLGPYLPARVVEAELRGLGVQPNSEAAQVLLHVAGPYMRCGQWVQSTVGRGGRAQAAAALDAVFEREAAPRTESLLQALTALGMPAEVASTYLESQVALRSFGDISVRWTGDTTANMAEAALHVLGAPATAEDILATIGSDAGRSLATVNGTLSEDDRFVRASRRSWGLRCWGITEYAGIAHAIGARIDAAGGTASVTDVVDDLLAAYPDIAETSIGTYLSTLEFVITAGVVRRRTQDDEWPTVAPLNTVRGAFRNGDNEIRLLIRVTADLLRGSGQAIHPAVAAAAGVDPGQRRTFTSPHGQITVFWPLTSTSGARIGSLRAQAVAVEATTADTLVLAFKLHDGSVEVSRMGPDDSAARWVEQLLGRPVPDPVAALASGLDCSPSEVAGVLRARGDHGLAAALDSI
ncbi:MAG: winged helix-turn-helix domain-containing protein [Actinomycetia bacterium]|nr:winged helix-turn-helix domain-containing protein [Actinomycetes bacterium]MCH9762588.1 winged helix-turn-helix domain-containing protein [Actinomycetes bacterium]